MCGPWPTDPSLCDECLEILNNNQEITEDDLCDTCKERTRNFCWCCLSVSDRPLNDEGLCENCEGVWPN